MSSHDELLLSVESAIGEHGFDAVTFEQIATEAGLNRVTLYRRGHTRESLLTEVAAVAAAEFREACLPALTHPGTAPERLYLLSEALFDLADRHLALLAGLFDGPTAIFHLTVDDHHVLTRLEYSDPFQRILSDGTAEGSMDSRDPAEDAEVLFNLLGWTYIHLRRSHGWDSARAREATRRQIHYATSEVRPRSHS
ncbi:MAG: TetR/AcrR family transcriptional regulator [Acidimicrobiales bacterium]